MRSKNQRRPAAQSGSCGPSAAGTMGMPRDTPDTQAELASRADDSFGQAGSCCWRVRHQLMRSSRVINRPSTRLG